MTTVVDAAAWLWMQAGFGCRGAADAGTLQVLCTVDAGAQQLEDPEKTGTESDKPGIWNIRYIRDIKQQMVKVQAEVG